MAIGRAHKCGDVIDPWVCPIILGGVYTIGDSSALHTQYNSSPRTHGLRNCGDAIDPWAFQSKWEGCLKMAMAPPIHSQHNNTELPEGTWRAQWSPGDVTMWHDRGTYMPIWCNMA